MARTPIAHLLLSVSPGLLACDYPDEGTMPLRRAVSKVKYLPETEAWSKARHEAGELVQYRLSLDRDVQIGGRCHWTVDVLSGSTLWRRFYVTSDGTQVGKESRVKSGR